MILKRDALITIFLNSFACWFIFWMIPISFDSKNYTWQPTQIILQPFVYLLIHFPSFSHSHLNKSKNKNAAGYWTNLNINIKCSLHLRTGISCGPLFENKYIHTFWTRVVGGSLKEPSFKGGGGFRHSLFTVYHGAFSSIPRKMKTTSHIHQEGHS